MQYLILFFLCLFTLIYARDDERFRQEVLTQHNIFRAEQCASPLQRNATLDKIAQEWSNKLAKSGQFIHSNTIDYGENSFQKIPFDFSKDNGATPVIAWYSEKSKYNLATPEQALHFTQLAWKKSTQIGIGISDIPTNGLIVVVNYYPRGNYQNQFAQNVGC